MTMMADWPPRFRMEVTLEEAGKLLRDIAQSTTDWDQYEKICVQMLRDAAAAKEEQTDD